MVELKYILVLVFLPTTVEGYAHFANRIPNGNNVPHPCRPNQLWPGVGHFNADGGGHRNPFGQDFSAAGQTWTESLCRQDSDGDGLTNGQELGDPECTWRPDDEPMITSGVTHPGVCQPLQEGACTERSLGVGVFRNQQQWLADACKDDGFTCQGLNDPDLRNLTIRIPSSPVPAEVTNFQCAIFDFSDVFDDVHMIATTPVVDNRQVLHHMMLYGCKGDTSDRPLETPFKCGMTPHSHCHALLSAWAQGSKGECYHNDMGVRIGVNGYKRVALQYHWNNPELVSNYTDSSGMTLYFTPNLRPNDAAVWVLGDANFVIPPGREEVTVESTCSARCTRSVMSRPLYVTAAFNHMHYLGVGQTTEHFRNNVSLGYITNDVTYSYDSPKFHTFSKPIRVEPGDELRTTCHYNSVNRTRDTVFGDTTQEMCFAFLNYYPESALSYKYCVTLSSVPFCDADTLRDRGCDPAQFARLLTENLFQDMVSSCVHHGECNHQCMDAILEATRREL